MQFLVETLPKFARELFGEAESTAKSLYLDQASNVFSRLIRKSSIAVGATSKQLLLGRCVFDLFLLTYFDEVSEYCGNKEISSLLVDALLYEATGSEASASNEFEVMFEGTQNSRGVHKFAVAQEKMAHIKDVGAWLFGSEVAAIEGHPKDIAIVMSVSTFSILLRRQAKWTIRFLLYGTMPNESEREEFYASLSELNNRLLNQFRGSS